MTNVIMDGAREFISAFNILGAGIVFLWIIGSIFLGSVIGEKKDERLIMIILLLTSGGILLFAKDPSQFIILIVAVVIILFGMFKILWGRNQ